MIKIVQLDVAVRKVCFVGTTSKTILKVMCQFLSPNPQPADYRKLINTIAPHDSDLTTYVSEVQTHNLQPSDTPDPTLPQSDGFPTPTLQ